MSHLARYGHDRIRRVGPVESSSGVATIDPQTCDGGAGRSRFDVTCCVSARISAMPCPRRPRSPGGVGPQRRVGDGQAIRGEMLKENSSLYVTAVGSIRTIISEDGTENGH